MENSYFNTHTEKELRDAFRDEASAHVKYVLFARQAADEGLDEVADEYSRIANEELAHAEMWLRESGGIGETSGNLKRSYASERAESETVYPARAAAARADGFESLAERFSSVGRIEGDHADCMRKMKDLLTVGGYVSEIEDAEWKCGNCGHITTDRTRPGYCPLCGCDGGRLRRRT